MIAYRLFELEEGRYALTRVIFLEALLLTLPVDSDKFIIEVVLQVKLPDFINEDR